MSSDIPETLSAGELTDVLDREFALGHAVSLTVTGSSMGPLLRHLRDRVILVSPSVRLPRRGEIVLFRRPDGSFVLHRILKEKEGGVLVMNGDAQVWTEEIRREQVCGVVSALVRKGRYISCDGGRYRCLSALWRFCMPVRGRITALYAAARERMRRRKGRRDYD